MGSSKFKNILLTLQEKDTHSGKYICIKIRLNPGFECKTKSNDWNFHNMTPKEFSVQYIVIGQISTNHKICKFVFCTYKGGVVNTFESKFLKVFCLSARASQCASTHAYVLAYEYRKSTKHEKSQSQLFLGWCFVFDILQCYIYRFKRNYIFSSNVITTETWNRGFSKQPKESEDPVLSRQENMPRLF